MNQQEKNRAVSLAVQESMVAGNVARAKEHMAADFKAIVAGSVLREEEWTGMGKAMMTTFAD